MRIVNALVYNEEGFFMPGEIKIEGSRFGRISFAESEAAVKRGYAGYYESGGTDRQDGAEARRGMVKSTVSKRGKIRIDAGGCYAIPGLVDIHTHGCAGYEYSYADRDSLFRMLRYQAENGVTTICPTLMTLSEETLARACGCIAGIMEEFQSAGEKTAGKSRAANEKTVGRSRAAGGTTIGNSRAAGEQNVAFPAGIYLEGPFLSPSKAGAQNPAYITPPDRAVFERLMKSSGNAVKILAIAPETEGAMDFIGSVAKDVIISIAHTNTDYDTAVMAIKRGARLATHLYNGMSAFAHRAPGVVGAVFDMPGVMAEIVCDGVHLHPASVRIAARQLGISRLIFISDSVAATGMGDGTYVLGELTVSVSGKVVRLVNGGNIAGSASNLMDCLRVAVKNVGMPLSDAVRYASVNPARLLGLQATRGGIAKGKIADLVLLDRQLNIKEVFVEGRRLMIRQSEGGKPA